MQKVHLNLKKRIDNSYNILIANGLFRKIPADLKKRNLADQYVIITDSNVRPLYGEELLRNLRHQGLKTFLISFPAGEKSKDFVNLEKILFKMSKFGLVRRSAVIALGGGVTGDIAGLAAAMYMRGINFINIPTTLLAQVDSSIGGKVGVDAFGIKNLIGFFWQSKVVYIDPTLLKTLSKKEFQQGLAEVIKTAMIKDRHFFSFLEKNKRKILKQEKKTLIYLIKKVCQIKAQVVQKDEKENALRRILNYGHTIGHGIESASFFKLNHGQAIALGMKLAGTISCRLGFLSKKELKKQNKLIADFHLPIKFPRTVDKKKIINLIKKDKKIVDKKIKFVLTKRIGEAFITNEVSLKLIKDILDQNKNGNHRT